MNISILDRLVSVFAYVTFGMFSVIWLIFANLTKKRISYFLSFNLYQAIFLSVILAAFSILYNIAINFMSVIPFVGKFAIMLNIFLNGTPIYQTFAITGFLIMLLICYLSVLSLIGKTPKLPFVSSVIKANIGG